ncbi:MAG: RcnB family protein [Janthinobacterium lividum]
MISTVATALTGGVATIASVAGAVFASVSIGYGYYSVPRSYWNRRWSVGQFLPDVFWRYQVNDYRTYGLGYPPPGTRWVYVDNSIYLIDEYDGYIIEVIRDAWRW